MEKRTTGHILRLNLAAELTHGMCVSNLAFQVACEMGLPPETCHELAVAGMVHDIGKLEISKYLYSREPDPLTIRITTVPDILPTWREKRSLWERGF